MLILSATGCDRLAPDRGPQTLELHGDTVQLGPGVELIEVELATLEDGREIQPQQVAAQPGDVVRFTARDGRMHALAFRADALAPDARAFLERTAQLRGPPLVAKGTQWVLNLEGAPVGDYPFSCTSHDQHGTIVIRPAEP